MRRDLCSLKSTQLNNEIITNPCRPALDTYYFNYIVKTDSFARKISAESVTQDWAWQMFIFPTTKRDPGDIMLHIPLCLPLQSPCWKSTDIFHWAYMSYQQLLGTRRSILCVRWCSVRHYILIIKKTFVSNQLNLKEALKHHLWFLLHGSSCSLDKKMSFNHRLFQSKYVDKPHIMAKN